MPLTEEGEGVRKERGTTGVDGFHFELFLSFSKVKGSSFLSVSLPSCPFPSLS